MDKITKVKTGLYLGSALHVQQPSDEFINLGINVVINCCDEIVHESNSDYVIEQFLIDDDGLTDSFPKLLDSINESIGKHLTSGLKVYVHCVHGVSRSAAAVIYYLMTSEKISFDLAYSKLLMMRPSILPNINFVKELKRRDQYRSDSDGFFRNKFSGL